MSRLSEFFRAYIRSLVEPVARVPSPVLVFASVALVSALQIPASFLMRAGYVSAGVVTNEVLVMAGLPMALVWLLGLERSRTIPFKVPSAAVAALVVILTFGAVVVIDYATAASEHFLPLPEDVKAQYDLIMKSGSSLGMAWKFLILCLLPGVCEEVFFHGFCRIARRALGEFKSDNRYGRDLRGAAWQSMVRAPLPPAGNPLSDGSLRSPGRCRPRSCVTCSTTIRPSSITGANLAARLRGSRCRVNASILMWGLAFLFRYSFLMLRAADTAQAVNSLAKRLKSCSGNNPPKAIHQKPLCRSCFPRIHRRNFILKYN